MGEKSLLTLTFNLRDTRRTLDSAQQEFSAAQNALEAVVAEKPLKNYWILSLSKQHINPRSGKQNRII